jgi:hypothetical protein
LTTILRLAGPFVRCAPLPAPLTVRPSLPVAAFAGMRLTLHSPGDGESEAQLRGTDIRGRPGLTSALTVYTNRDTSASVATSYGIASIAHDTAE